MWPFKKASKQQFDLPGVKFHSDGSLEFDFTAEEKREVEEFFEPLKQLKFHPDIADNLPKAATACALSRYSSTLVLSLTNIGTPEAYEQRKAEILSVLKRAIAAEIKAASLYGLPHFAKNLAYYYEMAGRKAEMAHWKEVYNKRRSNWRQSPLDELLIKWLNG